MSFHLLIEHIGSYHNSKGIIDTGENQNLVNSLLSVDGRKELYTNISQYKSQHGKLIKSYTKNEQLALANDPQFFRKQFIHYLAAIPDSKRPKYKGSAQLRETHPEKATISLERFIGKKGVQLYKLALEEEMYSTEYRNAVLQGSTTHYPGKKWAERVIAIVAGPSGSGKSYSARIVMGIVSKFIQKKVSTNAVQAHNLEPVNNMEFDETGNFVVAIDGGEARKASLIRRIAVIYSESRGFSGISDLHKQSSVLGKTKKYIQEAVFKSTSVNAVIPETFSMWFNPLSSIRKLMPRIEKLPNTKLIFSRVEGKHEDKFKRVINFLGSRRAWKTTGFTEQLPADLSYIPTHESKAYGKSGFEPGCKCSRYATDWYTRHSKHKLSLLIINDLILVKPSKDNPAEWVDATKDDVDAILVSQRQFESWQAFCKMPGYSVPLPTYIGNYTETAARVKTSAQIDLAIAIYNLDKRAIKLQQLINRQSPDSKKAADLVAKANKIGLLRNSLIHLDIHKVPEAEILQLKELIKSRANEERGFFKFFKNSTIKALELSIKALDKAVEESRKLHDTSRLAGVRPQV